MSLEEGLIFYIQNNNIRQVANFLRKGAKIHYKNDQPLRQAIYYGNSNIVELLLDNGADMNVNKINNLTRAIENDDIETVKLLLDRGTRVYHIKDLPIVKSVEKGNVDIVKVLLDHGAIITKSIFCYTAMSGHLKMIELMLKYDVDIDIHNGCALVGAVANNHYDLVNFLLDKGANINISDGQPLKSAVYKETKIIKLLLERGANIENIEDEQLMYTVRYNRADMLKLLLKNGARANINELLFSAVYESRPEIVEVLLSYRTEDDIKTLNYLLRWAAELNNAKIVEILFKHGAVIDDETMTYIQNFIHDISDKKLKNKYYLYKLRRGARNIRGTKRAGDLLTDWQRFCRTLGNHNVQDLRDISVSLGLPIEGLSKRKLCGQLAEHMEAMEYYQGTCEKNDYSISGTDFDQLPPNCVIKDKYGYCHDVEEVFTYDKNNYTTQPWDPEILEEARNKRELCARDRRRIEVHELKPLYELDPQLQMIRDILIETGTDYTSEIMNYERRELEDMLHFFNTRVPMIIFTRDEIDRILNTESDIEFLYELIILLQMKLTDEALGGYLNEFHNQL